MERNLSVATETEALGGGQFCGGELILIGDYRSPNLMGMMFEMGEMGYPG